MTIQFAEVEREEIRRMDLADLTIHGPWLLERVLKFYPNQTQRSVIGWFNGVITNNEFLCLTMPHVVGLAETVPIDRLSGKMIVREVFVWCEDPEDKGQVKSAIEFYHRMRDWARHQGIDKMIVGERSDVPIEILEKAFRLHENKTMIVRV